MSSSGWEAWSNAEYITGRYLKLALDSLRRLQERPLPEDEKRIAAATYLECLLSAMAAALLCGEEATIVSAIVEVCDRIWQG